MREEDLVKFMSQHSQAPINIRCDECSTIVMSKNENGSFWYTPYKHPCWSEEDVGEIVDKRWLGGRIGLLITVGREEREDEQSHI